MGVNKPIIFYICVTIDHNYLFADPILWLSPLLNELYEL